MNNYENNTEQCKARFRKLQERGVIIPDISSVRIGREVAPEKISSGCTLHPFVRISGEKTQIHSGAQIGVCGPATLENSWVGENAIVGNLGPVTLKESVVGPKSILGCGTAEEAVFLGKETSVNDFSSGYGFRVRKGSLYEEDASSAQHTDTKMTILFPWTTLGSNINFCDVLLAGGTGPELGFFSEIGSGTIHFNFSIRGDKATASLFGNATHGILLNQERLFIGGNNSLLGPIQADFGVLTAAGARINGSLSSGLHFGHSAPDVPALPKRKIDYNPQIFLGASGIVSKQVNFLAELAALFHWYQQIRIGCIAQTAEQRFLYQAGLRMVKLNFNERLAQLNRYVEFLENSVSLLSQQKNKFQTELAEQKELLKNWPNLQKFLQTPESFELPAPTLPAESILRQQAEGETVYTKLVKGLNTEAKQAAQAWLNTIAEQVCRKFKHFSAL